MQVPVQAALQQNPWAQKPFEHSLASAQLAPSGLSPQEPLLHTAGAAQSASAVQVLLHTAAPQVKGKQELAPGVMQAPAPSQVAPGVKVVVKQVESLQGVPFAYFWQAPASHLPSVPQVVRPWSRQVLAGSGAPVATLVQVPIDPDSAQDLQALAHADAQQTPCAQLPEAHSTLSEQNAPLVFLPHELPLQTFGGTQFVFEVHAVKHCVPLHAKGAQARASGATQVPVLLHVAGGV
jgi:hypothetical protein